MSQLLDLLRVATPPSPAAAQPTITLRDVLHLTALGYSLATATVEAPFSVVDEQVYKVSPCRDSCGPPYDSQGAVSGALCTWLLGALRCSALGALMNDLSNSLCNCNKPPRSPIHASRLTPLLEPSAV